MVEVVQVLFASDEDDEGALGVGNGNGGDAVGADAAASGADGNDGDDAGEGVDGFDEVSVGSGDSPSSTMSRSLVEVSDGAADGWGCVDGWSGEAVVGSEAVLGWGVVCESEVMVVRSCKRLRRLSMVRPETCACLRSSLLVSSVDCSRLSKNFFISWWLVSEI